MRKFVATIDVRRQLLPRVGRKLHRHFVCRGQLMSEHVFSTVSGLPTFGEIGPKVANASLGDKIEPLSFCFVRERFNVRGG
jgi:hypothetical protein